MSGFIRAAVVALGVAVGVSAGGCSSDGGGKTEESKQAVTSISSTRSELAKAKQGVNNAVASMDKLTTAGSNLEPAFKQYSADVKAVQASGDRARERAQAFRDKARQYVANWEKEVEQMQSPELRAGAAQRREKVKDNFDKIKETGRSVRDAYQPFLRDLQEIQRALANDLTPAGVDSAKLAINKAKTEGATLNQRIDTLIAQLDEVAGGMSSAPQAQGSKAQ